MSVFFSGQSYWTQVEVFNSFAGPMFIFLRNAILFLDFKDLAFREIIKKDRGGNE